MAFLDLFRRRPARPTEARMAAVQSMSAADFYAALGIPYGPADVDAPVTVESALGLPAVWAAVNFISGTMAGLPLQLYRRGTEGDRKRIGDTPLARILHDAVNDELSSFEWRKGLFQQVLTGGRALTFIERDAMRAVTNLWPLDPSRVTIKRQDGRRSYEFSDGGRLKTYAAGEIIDLAFMMKDDGLSHRGPIMANREVIGLAIAATRFGTKFFQNGGVPPFAVTGDFQSGKALNVAAEDLAAATQKAAKERRWAMTLPRGLDVKPLGVDAEKTQLVETKRFLIEEIARIYSLPPTFLQDLSHGTYSNTEQQDLHFVKHTIKRWVEAFEQEVNLKLFGRGKSRYFVELNMDGLLRGDFKARMDGYATAIQHGVLKPNEARQMENRPADPAGDRLLVQGAMVPLGAAGEGQGNGAGGGTQDEGDAGDGA